MEFASEQFDGNKAPLVRGDGPAPESSVRGGSLRKAILLAAVAVVLARGTLTAYRFVGTSPEQENIAAAELRRLWLHQANKTMNDYIGKKVLGRTPEPGEQPNILQDYANTSSAGSIIAFSKHSNDMASGDKGLICSFGAGYSVGSVIVERA